MKIAILENSKLAWVLLIASLLVFSCRSKKNSYHSSGVLSVSVAKLKLKDGHHTEHLQRLVNLAVSTGIDSFQFEKGEYIIDQLHLPPGAFVNGEDAIIKKKPYSETFSRMFTTKKFEAKIQTVTKPLIIQNFLFDGNYKNQGEFDNYELEHQAMVFLSAPENSKKQLKAIVRNCRFKEGAGDAIGVFRNVDLEVYNCEAENVFRGAVTVTGGNTKVYVDSLKAYGDAYVTGVDVEVDYPGFNKNFEVDIEMRNIWVDGDFDIAMRHGKFYGYNINSAGPPTYIAARNGSILIENSNFSKNKDGIFRILYPKNVVFNNCKFNFTSDKYSKYKEGIRIRWGDKTYRGKDQKLVFNACTFLSNNLPKALYCGNDRKSDRNHLQVNNCKFIGESDYGIYLSDGGNMDIVNTSLEANTSIYLNSDKVSSEGKYNVTLDNVSNPNSKRKKGSYLIKYKEGDGNKIELKNISGEEKIETFSKGKTNTRTKVQRSGKS